MEQFKRPSNPRIEIEDPDPMSADLDLDNGHIDRSKSPGNMSQDSQDSCHTEDATEQGYLNVNVRHAVRRSNSSVAAGMPCYTMSSSPRGIALLIDIQNYDNDVQDYRYGSEVSNEIVQNVMLTIILEEFTISGMTHLYPSAFYRLTG